MLNQIEPQLNTG